MLMVKLPVTVNAAGGVLDRPTVTTTLTELADNVLGTAATMLLALQLVTVAAAPPNVTVLDPCVAPKFAPEIVT